MKRLRLIASVFALALSVAVVPAAVAGRCELPTEHAGLIFPVTSIPDDWACRLSPILNHATTATKTGPVQTALSEPVYHYLLDRPAMAAALINRLDLGLYRVEPLGMNRYWGEDGEGTGGVVQLVYGDRHNRIYYLEGSHDSRLLPPLTGKAVVLLRMRPVRDSVGRAAVETTLVSYLRLDNRLLSGLVSVLRPLVGETVSRKLSKGIDTVNRLSRAMLDDPQRVLFEATDPPGLPQDQVAFLKEALGRMHAAAGPSP